MSSEQKLTHYCVFTDLDAQALVDEVLKAIRNGFVPLSGLTLAIVKDQPVFGQAMVKYE